MNTLCLCQRSRKSLIKGFHGFANGLRHVRARCANRIGKHPRIAAVRRDYNLQPATHPRRLRHRLFRHHLRRRRSSLPPHLDKLTRRACEWHQVPPAAPHGCRRIIEFRRRSPTGRLSLLRFLLSIPLHSFLSVS